MAALPALRFVNYLYTSSRIIATYAIAVETTSEVHSGVTSAADGTNHKDGRPQEKAAKRACLQLPAINT